MARDQKLSFSSFYLAVRPVLSIRSSQESAGSFQLGEGRKGRGGTRIVAGFTTAAAVLHWVAASGRIKLKALARKFCFSVFFLLPNMGQSSGSSPREDCKVTGQGYTPSSLSQHTQGHRSQETPSDRRAQVHMSPAALRAILFSCSGKH